MGRGIGVESGQAAADPSLAVGRDNSVWPHPSGFVVATARAGIRTRSTKAKPQDSTVIIRVSPSPSPLAPGVYYGLRKRPEAPKMGSLPAWPPYPAQLPEVLHQADLIIWGSCADFRLLQGTRQGGPWSRAGVIDHHRVGWPLEPEYVSAVASSVMDPNVGR